MGPGPETTATLSSTPGDDGGPPPDRRRLLVVERTSSRLVALPPAGLLFIGRAPDVDIRVEEPSASRRHAKLEVWQELIRVIDLGSRNGLRVNGALVRGTCDLSPGDVVTIGDVALILCGGRPRSAPRALLGAQDLAARLQQEIERALELGRSVSVAVVAPGPRAATSPGGDDLPAAELASLPAALSARLSALELAGRLPGGHLVIVFGERGGDEARAATSLLLEHLAPEWPAHRAGIASCPEDGCDAATLLSVARSACEGARARGLASAAERVRTIDLGDTSIVIADPAMIRLFSLIGRLAAADLPVLVTGETGVGKEPAALAVHHGSGRRAGPFVAVNCAAIPDALLEGELFGHAKGAFSGAHAAKPGLFERAAGGTLFLDEVGELSLAAQAKLLRALEGGRFRRLGETVEREADVRLVAATNRDLAREVRERRFREDLFYRLGSAVVLIPSLRDRPADIPVLARRFLAAARARAGKGPLVLAPDAMLALAQHGWPGNVRELKSSMEYVAAAVERGVVERDALPAAIAGTASAPVRADEAARGAPGDGAFRPLGEEIEALERQRIREALSAASGVKTRAARLIGVPERTFRLKLRQYGLG